MGGSPKGKKAFKKRMQATKLRKEERLGHSAVPITSPLPTTKLMRKQTRKVTLASVETALATVEEQKEEAQQVVQAASDTLLQLSADSRALENKKQEILAMDEMEMDQRYTIAAKEYMSYPEGPERPGFKPIARKHGGLDDKTLKRFVTQYMYR